MGEGKERTSILEYLSKNSSRENDIFDIFKAEVGTTCRQCSCKMTDKNDNTCYWEEWEEGRREWWEEMNREYYWKDSWRSLRDMEWEMKAERRRSLP